MGPKVMAKLPTLEFVTDPKRIAEIDKARDRAKIATVNSLVRGKPAKKFDPRATLADAFKDPKLAIDYFKVGPPGMKYSRLRSLAAQAKMHVLDDEATILAAELAHASVESMLRILKLAIPKNQYSWFELPANTLMRVRQQQNSVQSIVSRPESARMCIFVEWFAEERYFVCHCIEHDQEGSGGYFVWPVAYRVSVDGPVLLRKGDSNIVIDSATKTAKLVDEIEHENLTIEQASYVWGYDSSKHDLTPLIDKAICEVPADYAPYIKLPVIKMSIREMQGFTRLVCAILAMLNAVPVVEVTSRPKGQRLVGGASRPYVERTTISVNIPKRVRMRRAFAERAIAREVKRRKHHHVDPHFRHLEHKPKAEGWQACITPWGTPGYRKLVRDHWRGDKDLGKVAEKTVIIHGPRA